MASSPRETPSTGAILDVRVAGDCHLRHQAASLDVLRSAARSPRCVCPLCDDAEPSWSQHASELLPARNLHDLVCALPHGWTGSGLIPASGFFSLSSSCCLAILPPL